MPHHPQSRQRPAFFLAQRHKLVCNDDPIDHRMPQIVSVNRKQPDVVVLQLKSIQNSGVVRREQDLPFVAAFDNPLRQQLRQFANQSGIQGLIQVVNGKTFGRVGGQGPGPRKTERKAPLRWRHRRLDRYDFYP